QVMLVYLCGLSQKSGSLMEPLDSSRFMTGMSTIHGQLTAGDASRQPRSLQVSAGIARCKELKMGRKMRIACETHPHRMKPQCPPPKHHPTQTPPNPTQPNTTERKNQNHAPVLVHLRCLLGFPRTRGQVL